MNWGLTCAVVAAVLCVDGFASTPGDPPGRFRSSGTRPVGPTDEIVASDRQPASLLVYPEYDNRMGNVSLLTLTNVNDASSGEVKVEIVYLNEEDCSEFNRVETLTSNDTLTLLTDAHNPQLERGYVYAFAREGTTPIVWNHLIGNLMIIDGFETFEYSTNPLSFVGIGSAGGTVQADGTPTDLDQDGHRDLDGQEYALSPEEILVPRFLGQNDQPEATESFVSSQLVLIGLSGGSKFDTTVDFLVYNDNEEVFSSEYTFSCWAKPYLLEISNLFSNDFLAYDTNDDPDEVLGAPELESGWFRMDGAVSNSVAESIDDPAVFCVLVERVSIYAVASLPFSIGGQDNGALLPRGIEGDGDPDPEDGDNQ